MASKFQTTLGLPRFASDPSSTVAGYMYYNTTDNAVKVYNGSTWDEVGAGAGGAASSITYDNSSSGLTATNTQDAIDEVEARVDTAEADIATNAGNIASNTAALATKANVTLNNLGTTAINADLLPAAFDVYDLGSSGLQWRALYVSTAVHTANLRDASDFLAFSLNDRKIYDTSGTDKLSISADERILYAPDGDSYRLEWGYNGLVAFDNSSFTSANFHTRTLETDGVAKLDWSGDDISVNTRKIINLVDPTAAQDAATKQYVDDAITAAAPDAVDVVYDNSSSSLAATNVQAAIDEVEARVDAAESNINYIADLVTLSGVAPNSTDLGTFTGSIISDNVTIKDALQEIEDAIEGLPNPITYEGTWAASTNTPTLADGVGDQGDLYQVSDAGTVDFGSGNISFEAGDKVVYNGSTWDKWDMTDAVSSVNGQTGAVILDSGDISYDNASSGLTATTAQDAIDEVEGRLDTVETSAAASAAALAGKADTDLGNLASTAVNADINPASDSSVDLGSSSLRYAETHAVTTNTQDIYQVGGETLKVPTSIVTSLIVDKFVPLFTLTDNTTAVASALTVSTISQETYNITLNYTIFQGSNTRSGLLIVAINGSSVDISDGPFAEVGDVGVSWSVALNGTDYEFSYTTENAGANREMIADMKVIRKTII